MHHGKITAGRLKDDLIIKNQLENIFVSRFFSFYVYMYISLAFLHCLILKAGERQQTGGLRG